MPSDREIERAAKALCFAQFGRHGSVPWETIPDDHSFKLSFREHAKAALSAAATARPDHSEAELEVLRDVWRLSQEDDMIIWVAGRLQRLVLDRIGGEDADVDAILFQRASLGEGEGGR